VLVAFSAGSLPDDSFEQVAQHVEQCARCLAVLQDRSSQEDSVRNALHTPAASETFAEEPQAHRPILSILAKLRASPDFSIDKGLTPTSVPDYEKATVDDGQTGVPASRTVPEIPGYKLVRRLGGGGMGDVYEAVHALGNRFALKVIRADRDIREFNARFRNEAATLQELHHPNVIRIFEYNEPGGTPFFTMRLLTGGTLLSRMSEFRADPRKAVGLVATVAEALAYLHQREILHRDLKPSNIMFDDDDHPIVTDFGLTKQWKEGSPLPEPVARAAPRTATVGEALLDEPMATEPAALTMNGRALGTPPYMSPEQLQGDQGRIAPRSDVWGLGVILYELLTGERPFDGKNDREVRKNILAAKPRPPRSLKPRLHYDLETIVLKCLDEDPARRYDAAELADDLHRWERGEPIHGRRLPVAVRVSRFVYRHALACAVAASLMAVVGVMAARYVKSPERARESAIRKLKKGEEVTLIGSKGRPAFGPAFVLGAAGSSAFVNGEGSFSVNGNDLALAEFLPELPVPNYRIKADIRHDGCREDGAIGIYFGHRAIHSEKGTEHIFYELSFSDIKTNSNEGWPLTLRIHYRLDAKHDEDNKDVTWTTRLQIPQEQSNLLAPGPWRSLVVELNDDGVNVLQGEKIAGSCTFKKLQQMLDSLRKMNPDTIPASLDPYIRGGIGIYAFRSTLSVQSLSIEPLTSNP
jgi:serine/threonine-protein kinase